MAEKGTLEEAVTRIEAVLERISRQRDEALAELRTTNSLLEVADEKAQAWKERGLEARAEVAKLREKLDAAEQLRIEEGEMLDG